MPELPEMQGLAERLAELIGGATVKRIDVLSFSALKTVTPSPLDLHGMVVKEVGRRGKYLVLDFEKVRMLVHLSQGGRVDVEKPPKKTKPRGAVMRMNFENGLAVLIKEFGTERKAAWWVLGPEDPGPLEGLGPEPDDEEFLAFLRESDDNRRIHTILRDQRTVAGIGRGYSDDILHRARLSPYDGLRSLDDAERERLIEALAHVLATALEGERKRTGGLPTKLSDRFTIHRRHGQPCPRCGDTLRRVWFESHEISYCPTCQTEGKILADRRMSRLLK